ncbi:hypothetical protein [Natronococcus sp. A-GB7]|uniref:hypothetical protein n=1 Tax=Natronococcus sp. A-GB7 TaxID=3037649 RepID=UPI00241BFB5E|nr:hypothetical protein [Natronococcus sp. A-GB7]MDG5818470.1 hypothetical protein [Natronococcus sp. A-GB7]
MIEPYRRSVIAGGFALVAGSAISAVGTGDEDADDGADADSNDNGTDAEGADEEGRVDESGDELEGSDEESGRESVDDPATAAPALELSVSLPGSIPAPKGRAEFLITVGNRGEETVSTPIALEVGCVEDELETPTLAPGESADAYASYAGTRLGRGTHEWSVAVGAACERGTLSVT